MSLDSQTFSPKELALKLPFSLILAGPSGSGKTSFLLKFLSQANDLVDPPPTGGILYCYGQFNPIIPKLQKAGVTVYAGLPPEEYLKRFATGGVPFLCIFDDLMLHADETYVIKLFTVLAHHLNMGMIFVVQHLFHPRLRIAKQNAQYIIVMRSPHNLALRNLATQIFPKRLEYFLQSYQSATSVPWGYLLIDLHPSSPSTGLLRLRTGLFKDDEKTIFIPKSG